MRKGPLKYAYASKALRQRLASRPMWRHPACWHCSASSPPRAQSSYRRRGRASSMSPPLRRIAAPRAMRATRVRAATAACLASAGCRVPALALRTARPGAQVHAGALPPVHAPLSVPEPPLAGGGIAGSPPGAVQAGKAGQGQCPRPLFRARWAASSVLAIPRPTRGPGENGDLIQEQLASLHAPISRTSDAK